MALLARNRTLLSGRMAGDAQIMSGIFTPTIDLADLGGVAAKALVVNDLLVPPVHKRKNQISHFDFDDLGAVVRRSFGKHRNSPGDSPPNKT